MTWRVYSLRQSVATAAFLLAACFDLVASAHGQDVSPAHIDITAKTLAFEVVSVRPAKPNCLGMSTDGSPGRYMGRCITLWGMIYNAYEVRSFQDYPPGLPAWADKDTFDIEAKADDDTTAAMKKLSMREQGHMGREMLQSLLAERFKLRVHYDEKPGGMSGGPGRMTIHGMSFEAFAHFMSLSNLAGRTVVDKTGLTGNYDIDLKWTPDDQQGTPDAGPTLFTALEEQLGLKLVPAKGPVETLVIDHVERPSEN